jgi:hypothetical protein
MDENVQQKIAQACIALLGKDAANDSQERACSIQSQEEVGPSTKKEAIEWLLNAASEQDISLQDVTDALWIIFKRSRPGSKTRHWVTRLLFDLMQREGNTPGDAIELAKTLYHLSPQDSQEHQAAFQALLALAKRRDIPFGDAVEAAYALYWQSPHRSQERRQASEMLLEQARWPDITAAQMHEAALALCHVSPYRSEERKQAIQALLEVYERPDLTFEDAENLDYVRSVQASNKALQRQQLAAKKRMWEAVALRPDLTSEQRSKIARAIEDYRNFLQ